MSTHQAKCDRCRYSESFGSPLCSYELSDGVTVPIKKTFVWCGKCMAPRWGEVLPDIGSLETDLVGAREEDPCVVERLKTRAGAHTTIDQLLANHIEKVRARLAWRRARRSPPRCLECGSVEISSFEQSGTRSGFEKWTRKHPVCEGTIIVVALPALALDRSWIRYTPEGEKKQAYEMSPAHGAVPTDGATNALHHPLEPLSPPTRPAADHP